MDGFGGGSKWVILWYRLNGLGRVGLTRNTFPKFKSFLMDSLCQYDYTSHIRLIIF